MMWNGDGSWGHGWWWSGLVMALFMAFCVVMMVRMMGHGAHGSHTMGSSSGPGRDMPEHTLASRLASGEIDIDEYERRLAALRASTGRDSTQGPGRQVA